MRSALAFAGAGLLLLAGSSAQAGILVTPTVSVPNLPSAPALGSPDTATPGTIEQHPGQPDLVTPSASVADNVPHTAAPGDQIEVAAVGPPPVSGGAVGAAPLGAGFFIAALADSDQAHRLHKIGETSGQTVTAWTVAVVFGAPPVSRSGIDQWVALTYTLGPR
jgi:hypothetical protein